MDGKTLLCQQHLEAPKFDEHIQDCPEYIVSVGGARRRSTGHNKKRGQILLANMNIYSKCGLELP